MILILAIIYHDFLYALATGDLIYFVPRWRLGETACILAGLFALATQYAVMENEK